MPNSSWAGKDLAQELANQCGAAGFDLVTPLQVGWYNDVVEPHLVLPDFGSPRSLAVLIGNSRALWPRLLDTMRADTKLRDDRDPVEAYTMRRVLEAAGDLQVPHEIHWAHIVAPRPIAIQRMAHVAGLAYLTPSKLSAHPTYGPWIALRAVIVADVTGPPDPQPVVTRPCNDCEHACLAAFRGAVAEPNDWRHWLAIRDACPTGRAYRYDDRQIVYHYTKDRGALRRAVDEQC